LSRRVISLNKLFGFVQEHGKTLASVSESLDLSTWIGRLVANVIAGVAEGELEAIRWTLLVEASDAWTRYLDARREMGRQLAALGKRPPWSRQSDRESASSDRSAATNAAAGGVDSGVWR
jgi:hypothetical protein